MSATNPTFTDIVTLLTTLVGNDPNIGEAPHSAFWKNVTRDAFVALPTDNWGVQGISGQLVNLKNPAQSPLYLALTGTGAMTGIQMPDTEADPNGRHATSAEQAMVLTWITNGAPA